MSTIIELLEEYTSNYNSELFANFIGSVDSFELHDMDNDIKANGWGIKKITDVDNVEDFMTIFQIFYRLTGRLPLSNGLLVIPGGDARPEEDRVNMKSLYEMFKHTNSHGLVSLPFLGLIQYYLEKNDHSLTKSELTEPYPNLLYITLSGARDFRFETVSDLTAKLSFLLKHAIVQNIQKKRKNANTNVNNGCIFNPKINDPLVTVIDILDDILCRTQKNNVSLYPTSGTNS